MAFSSDDDSGLRHQNGAFMLADGSIPQWKPTQAAGCATVSPATIPHKLRARIMAYIRQYAGKWRAEVERHGHRSSKLCDTKAEARAWALSEEQALHGLKASKGRAFGVAVEHYLKTVTSQKRSQDWERRRFDAMREFFGDQTALSRIDSAEVGKWRDDRLQTVSGSTVNREANLLRNLFSVAVNEWRWIDRNPFQGVKLPKEAEPRSSLWGWREIRRMLRHCEAAGDKTREVGRAFHIALRTGMRLGEVLAAPGALRDGVVTLPHSKTSSKPVKVPVGRVAARLIAECPPFTVGANEASNLFCVARKQAGLPSSLRFHDARATALTHMSRRVDALTLAKVSRHKDLSLLLNVYYRDTPEAIAKRL